MAIQLDIERGRLKPGQKLPGTRALAKKLQLHRNTVDASYEELKLQGWIYACASKGTFVTDDIPHRSSTAMTSSADVSKDQRSDALIPIPSVQFSDGVPDARLMPGMELGRALRRVIKSGRSTLGYGDPRGDPSLRDALVRSLTQERGLNIRPENILLTHGSQMALYLAARALLSPGDVIAVENPGYRYAWSAFQAAGATLHGIPVDEDGLDVDALEELARNEPALKSVFVTPQHQYPTTVTLSAARRVKLLELAERYKLTIIEDDYDHDYHYLGHPALSLASRAPQSVSVIYIGSLSKLFAPGLRIGYAITNCATLDAMADYRQFIDRQGDVILERAVASLIIDGDLRRHARKMRQIYKARRDHAANLLSKKFGRQIDFSVPNGGLAFWVKLTAGQNSQLWSRRAQEKGIHIASADQFFLETDKHQNAFRIGFAALRETEFSSALNILAKTCPDPD